MKACISRETVLEIMKYLADKQVGDGIWFEIPKSNNNAILKIEKGYTAKAEAVFTTGVVARDDDHLVRHFLHFAPSLDELRNWLKNPDNADCIIVSLQELSDRVDKGFD